jgi:hypothetical protein
MSKKADGKKPGKKWSGEVTEHSDAMDLEQGVFKQSDPKAIADSLKRSAEHSDRRKSSPFRSAMSMLNFYINRGGSKISEAQRKRLETAKDELRQDFDRAGAETKPAARTVSGSKKRAATKASKPSDSR